MSRTTLATLLTTAFIPLASAGLADTGEEIVANVCGACHLKDDKGQFSRIDSSRRTPEGWEMNIVRMMRNYGIRLSDEDFVTVLRYLSDTRGLSIAETDGFRYILEREPLADDHGPDDLMTQTCGRCHSYARVALQRRTPEDWEKLLHFHLGQFPSLEYQALARDRDWWGIAQGDVLKELTTRYVLGDPPAKADADLSGEWRVAGRQPGRGAYDGTLTIERDGDGYKVTQVLAFVDGQSETGTGSAYLYGAGEWRATMTAGDAELHEVMALREDGSMDGRWFHSDQTALGGRIHAVRTDAPARILSVTPDHIRAGETVEMRVSGVGLSGDVALPAGLTAETVSSDATAIVLNVTAAADAVAGRVAVGVGEATLDGAVGVYSALDRVSVEPAVTYSRIGDNGGPIAKQPAVFDAIGWLNGPDGQPETGDDIRIGAVPAEWAVDNFDAAAVAAEDTKFAGQIGPSGVFEPAGAGPNPERVMSTNNAGNLSVIATVKDGDRTLEGRGQLYATVQRFVDTPIR
ncbi:MAG: quinohemoprotein amine dehydrogenase subunit alpha [Rhodobacteraceae bacterium]|jgi:quinohemoprotein amine dehydrogenase|uniref:quinohemoprotein amine dehydrogenase subunit alpha n=1 Tax=Albidovulum sp. TaxID=1872424 RepID=UPI001D81D113|nr:quinohemoprotein amine dehydrogenase subunit alpha [uncultured Defluviimonas sp.]MCB2126712.1 quinohemoprotein amine dehydrogenase subunit alpha [Paracoccaceae bacterium]MCC0071223.1 quinohemoprotein amine dehydrogenase subunit alpha [Paracoccaceae bacterium]